MNLQELRAKGAFVSTVPVIKEVEWIHKDQETGEDVTERFSIGLLRQSFGLMERLWNGPDERSKSASLVSHCILFGDEQMSYEDAYQLDPGLAAVLVKAINELNTADQAKPKN